MPTGAAAHRAGRRVDTRAGRPTEHLSRDGAGAGSTLARRAARTRVTARAAIDRVDRQVCARTACALYEPGWAVGAAAPVATDLRPRAGFRTGSAVTVVRRDADAVAREQPNRALTCPRDARLPGPARRPASPAVLRVVAADDHAGSAALGPSAPAATGISGRICGSGIEPNAQVRRAGQARVTGPIAVARAAFRARRADRPTGASATSASCASCAGRPRGTRTGRTRLTRGAVRMARGYRATAERRERRQDREPGDRVSVLGPDHHAAAYALRDTRRNLRRAHCGGAALRRAWLRDCRRGH